VDDLYAQMTDSRPVEGVSWIAAQFDATKLPPDMVIGDGKRHGTSDYINWPLPPGQNYFVFLRAFTGANVCSIIRPKLSQILLAD